uniref:Dihydroorotate dehydrogenase catalytic domain-containing protein n=1 Tax=Glossina austeni TaxID=7395 RepID=A0A1A9VX64_GLOAU
NKVKSLTFVAPGGGCIFSALCINQSNEKFYEEVVTQATRLLPPEFSHKAAVWASGFDKHAKAVEDLSQPRCARVRLVADEAIINRYGFNSEGHRVVYECLKAVRESGQFSGILGVNLSRNKDSTSAVKVQIRQVRDLQGKNDLQELLEAVIQARNQLSHLTKQDIKDIVAVVNKKSCKIDGLIISNTTVSRQDLKDSQLALENGGLSGAPLRSKSTHLVAQIYYQTGGKIPIIGVSPRM